MFRITFVILFIVIALLEVSLSLVELPTVEENHIVKAEAAIRETANLLFSKLKIKEKYFKSPIKHYFIAHNYFIGITLQDYVNLKEIARLTRVDKNDEVNAYTDILNEILNEDTDKEVREVPDEDVSNTIQNLMSEIRYVTVENNTQAKEFNSEILNQIINQNNNWTEENELGTALDDYDEETISNGSSNESVVWSPEPMTRRIYQGRMTKIKRYPFMAVVQLFDQFYCAGSIIDQDLVLTAASCVQLAWNNRFFRENPAFLSVRVGSTFYAGGGEIINVQEVYFHPSYNPKNLRDNICVLRLVRHLKFGSGKNRVRRVKMIEIDRAASALPTTTAGITTLGWGARDASNIIKGAWANRLSYSVLDIYPHHDCRDVYSKEYVGPQTFCAGFISKGSGACNRDVGGPGIVNGILVGIISFGSAVCGVPDYPTVFTKVGFYADWIEEIMEMDVPVQVAHTTRSTTYAYTTKAMLQTTTIRMEPIGDVNEIFVEAVNQEVLRNRLPEAISGEPVKSESIEIDIQSANTDLNKPVFTTVILPDTVSTTPASPESSESSNDSDSASVREAKRKRQKKKKQRESVEVLLEEPMERPLKEAPKGTSERPRERMSHQPQQQRLEQKDVLTIEDSMPLYEENQWQSQEKPPAIKTTPQTEYEYLEREEPMIAADEKLVEETITTTIATTTATTTTTKKPKKMRKKKTLRKRKSKKSKKETSKTTKTTQKELKTTTKMTALRKRTTSSAEALSGLSGEEDRPTAKAIPQTKPMPDTSLTTLADNNNNPLDTLSQKEFYALLAEVLDKLERDTSKDS